MRFKRITLIFIKKTYMSFRTRIDISENRQAKQREGTEWILPGITRFGLPQEELSTGPDLDSARTLVPSIDNVTSTFTGNTLTGEFVWSFGFPDMDEAEHRIVNFDLNSPIGSVQEIGPIWVGRDTIELNGETIFTRYEGIIYDLTLAEINDLGDGNVEGSTRSTYEKVETDALDYNGDYIWVDVRGNIKTDNIFIKKIGIGASTVELGANAEGKLVGIASDIRLKENITPLQNSLEKVMLLDGFTYNWKDRQTGTDAIRIGFISQQVREVIPELVYEIPNSEYLGVHYNNVTPLLVEAIKELNSKLEETKVVTNDSTTTTTEQLKEVHVEIVYSEDNSIELNYGGTHETSVNGGIVIKKGVDDETDSLITTNENGDWVLSPGFIIPNYTPTSSDDIKGNQGYVCQDDDYLYIKTSAGWKRTSLESF